MRIPFLPRLSSNDISAAQVQFIQASHGGSPLLFAGATFWFVAGLLAIFLPLDLSTSVYLYGGLLVPLFGFGIARLQRTKLLQPSQYTSLATIAPMMTVFCLPILFVLADINPLLPAAALTIIDAGHLPVLMWIHLDYTYFLAACAKLVIGLAFLLSFPDMAPVGVGILSGCVSLLAGWAVWKASRDPLRPYLRTT